MALVFQDSFDNWGVGTASRTAMLNSSNMWVRFSTAAVYGCTTSVYRTGTHSLYANDSGGSVNDEGAIFSLGGIKSSASGYHGFGLALRIGNAPSTLAPLMFFYNVSGAIEYTLYLTASNTLQLYKSSSSGTLLATSSAGILTPNIFTHFEVKQKIQSTANGTDGEFYLKVNGTQVIGVTGTDIFNLTSGTPQIETVGLLPKNVVGDIGDSYIDDMYVWDSTGSYCNDWIGNKACYVFYCDADTATADWTITGATQGFDAINDTTPDADTSYLAATANGNVSIFELPTITSTLTGIKAATVHSLIRQSSAGTSEMRVSLGGTTYTDGTSRVAPFPGGTSSTYTAYQDHFYVDPDGAGTLTPTILSALKLKLTRTV